MFRASRKLLTTLPCVLALASCAASTTPGPGGPPGAALPEYSAAEATLFDDSVAPATLEPLLVDSGFSARQRFSQRTMGADFISAVRVATVSEMGKSFDVTLEPVGAPLRGRAVAGALTLSISARAPAFGFLTGHRAQFIGSTVIVFLKTYGVDGIAETHFRIEPDSPQVRRSVEQAIMLGELGS